MTVLDSNLLSVANAITADGYVFVRGEHTQKALQQFGQLTDWADFAASWNDLHVDNYMADKGRYRRRRYAVYAATGDSEISRQVHQPHYQSLDYNHLNGGIERWFEPIEEHIGDGASMGSILRFCRNLFASLAPDVRQWHIEAHQFRIEASEDKAGQPTPEGMHRDGVDYVFVLLIQRHNVASGTTIIRTVNRDEDSFTLADPFDSVLVDDARVHHGVTPVEALDVALPAYRDVLVVTFRRSR